MTKPSANELRNAAIQAVLGADPKISTEEALKMLELLGPNGVEITAAHIEEFRRSKITRRKKKT